jgi:hypothetical protein
MRSQSKRILEPQIGIASGASWYRKIWHEWTPLQSRIRASRATRLSFSGANAKESDPVGRPIN